MTAISGAGLPLPAPVTATVNNEVQNPVFNGTYFRQSSFQATDPATGELINLLDDTLLDTTYTVIEEDSDTSLSIDSVPPSWTQNIGVSTESSSGTSQLSVTPQILGKDSKPMNSVVSLSSKVSFGSHKLMITLIISL